MASDSSDQNKLRLLVDSSTGRVLYSEAHKTFVDFFFSLLTMPMGTVIELLSSVKDDNNEVGSLMNIYKSVQELNGNYMLNASHKDELLHPKVYRNACTGSEFLKIKAAPNVPNANETYYICTNSVYGGAHSASNVRSSYCSCGYQRTSAITLAPNVPNANETYYICTSSVSGGAHSASNVRSSYCSCGYQRTSAITLAPNVPNANETYNICTSSVYGGAHNASNVRSSRCSYRQQRTSAFTLDLEDNTSTNKTVVASVPGYVKETVTFIITDDLQVTPASTISSIMLLNKLNVRDVSKLQERWVVVGYNEAVKLLKAAMTSKHALNEVFGKVTGEETAKSTTTKR